MSDSSNSSGASIAKIVGLTIATFVIIGVGICATGFIGINFSAGLLSGDSGSGLFTGLMVLMIFFTSVVVVLFAGPIVAGSAGIFAGMSLENPSRAAVVSGAASFVGFYLMVLIAMSIIVVGAGQALPEDATGTDGGGGTDGPVFGTATPTPTPTPEGGGGGGGGGGPSFVDTGNLVVTFLKGGIPTAIVGCVAGVIGTQLG